MQIVSLAGASRRKGGKVIRIVIVQVSKGYGPKDKWQGMNQESRTFADLDAAMAYLKDRYGNCKRTPMFRETSPETETQIGYVYHFHNADWSHAPVVKWLQQDRVEFQKVEYLDMAKRGG
jgi:hypothetical protein